MLAVYGFFFFFQAEDGIRDKLVTGVQTCALPIYARERRRGGVHGARARGRQVRRQDGERRGGGGEPRRRRGGLHGERRHPHLHVRLRRGDDRERVDRGGDGEGELDGRRGVPHGERRHHARFAVEPLGRGAGGDGERGDLHGLPADGHR